jgi:hypothetical protein
LHILCIVPILNILHTLLHLRILQLLMLVPVPHIILLLHHITQQLQPMLHLRIVLRSIRHSLNIKHNDSTNRPRNNINNSRSANNLNHSISNNSPNTSSLNQDSSSLNSTNSHNHKDIQVEEVADMKAEVNVKR